MIHLKKYRPDPGQEAFHYAISKLYRFVAMICGIRGGKCLSVNQEVLLANGQKKKSGDIKRGDSILGFELNGDCESIKVCSTQNTMKETALYLLSDGSSIECSTDHAFPCWNAKRERFEEYPISYIAKRNDNYLYLLSSNNVCFNSNEGLVIHPYLLGILLGDGCMTQNIIFVSTKDNEILEACASLTTNLEIKQRHRNCDYGLVSNVRDRQGYSSNYLVTQLRELGLMGKDSHTKFIPREYMVSGEQDRLELLAGLVDTDGCVNKNGKIEFASTSIQLIKDVQFMLRSLGIRTEIHERVTKCNDKSFLSYRINWKDDSLPLRIKRKFERLEQRRKQRSDRLYVKGVIPLGLRPCVDISVSNKSHLFLLDNFIATHNTYAGAREAGRQAWNSKCEPMAVFGIIAPTFNMLDRTTWKEFRFAMRSLIASENESKKIIKLKNGREVYGFSAEEPDRIRNVTLCGFWVDEARECKDFGTLWNVLLGRVLSTGGKGFVTTSPNSFDAIHDIFIANKKPDYGTIRFSTYENTHLDKLAIDELASKYDEKYMQQELYGEFVIFEGAVYYTFSRTQNAGDLAFKVAQYNPNIPIALCCDFNIDPMAWVIAQIVQNETSRLKEVRVIDEIYMKNSNTIDACQEFKVRYPNHSAGLTLYGDATGRARHTDSNITNWKIIESELSAYRISSRVPTKNPAERDRINAVNGIVCNSKGQRRVFIHPEKCKHLIRDLEQVSYAEGSTKIDKSKDWSLTHPSDAFGYMADTEFSLARGRIEGLKI